MKSYLASLVLGVSTIFSDICFVDTNTGDLVSVDYSDSTPDISYTYNRIGQQKTVTDAVGTRTFAYNNTLQPLTETITGLYSKTIGRSYETTGVIGRYTGVNIGTEYDVDYGYDTYGRFSTVTNGSDVFTYGYLTNSNLVSGITYPNNITVTNAYESNRDLIDYVENKYNTTTISKYDYTNDAIGRRTAMAKSGSAFTASDTVNFTYNTRSEITQADAVNDANYLFDFTYDPIGNRETYTTSESGNPVQSLYTANNLNQYTSITNPSQSPTYDPDGNMLTMTLNSGSWTNTFNAENRIIVAEKSDAKLEFSYDYMGRRVEKKVYSGSTGNWTLDKHLKFVYDGYLQIEELDALNSDNVDKKRIWGMGKIICDVHGTTAYYALGDANKNITEYLDSSGTLQAHYEYSPFGKITAKLGLKQDDFDFRFSSEFFDHETGLVYYNYRYYSPELGRWTNRDPITEIGGFGLYAMVSNTPINFTDILGLKNAKPVWIYTGKEEVVAGSGKCASIIDVIQGSSIRRYYKKEANTEVRLIPGIYGSINPDEFYSNLARRLEILLGYYPGKKPAEIAIKLASKIYSPGYAVYLWTRTSFTEGIADGICMCDTSRGTANFYWAFGPITNTGNVLDKGEWTGGGFAPKDMEMDEDSKKQFIQDLLDAFKTIRKR